MIVKNTAKEKNTVTFDVELEPAEFERHVNAAYLKNRSKIMIPGFRKGKAPRMVVEGMYGADVFYEDASTAAAPEAFAFAVEQEKLRPVGRPGVENVAYTPEKGAVLTFRTDVWPEVTLGQYKGLEAERAAVTVEDTEVDAEVERMRKQNARLVTVERAAADGDSVNIDYRGTVDGVAFEGGAAEGHTLVLGSHSFIPGFEEQVVGMSAGEEKDVNVTFPDKYHAEDLAGKAAVFHVKCNEVKVEELPELDDEFAKDNDFDTLQALRDDVRERLEKSKKEASDNAFEDALVDKAVENMTVDVPESMIEERMDSMLREYAQYMAGQGIRMEEYLKMVGSDVATFREGSRATAVKQTKTELLLEAVAKAEGLEVTEEDLKAEYEKIAGMYGMKVEDVEKAMDAEGLREDLLRRKAGILILENGVAAKPKKKAAKPRAKAKKTEEAAAPVEAAAEPAAAE